ncbi:MAG: hypothetical protein IPJ07_00210 [Acidobacteria bacterium]|nr:hypothetical protein [Acidobacteriota bacterium]
MRRHLNYTQWMKLILLTLGLLGSLAGIHTGLGGESLRDLLKRRALQAGQGDPGEHRPDANDRRGPQSVRTSSGTSRATLACRDQAARVGYGEW